MTCQVGNDEQWILLGLQSVQKYPGQVDTLQVFHLITHWGSIT